MVVLFTDFKCLIVVIVYWSLVSFTGWFPGVLEALRLNSPVEGAVEELGEGGWRVGTVLDVL